MWWDFCVGKHAFHFWELKIVRITANHSLLSLHNLFGDIFSKSRNSKCSMPTGQLTLTVESSWLVEGKMSTFNKVNMGLQTDRCQKHVCKYQLKGFMDSFCIYVCWVWSCWSFSGECWKIVKAQRPFWTFEEHVNMPQLLEDHKHHVAYVFCHYLIWKLKIYLYQRKNSWWEACLLIPVGLEY